MIIDVIVLLVLIASVLIAFLRGFIREILTIIGIIGGMAAAYFTGPMLAPTMRGWLGVKEAVEGEEQAKLFDLIPYIYVADALAYGAIFIVFVVILSFLSHFLAEFVSKIGLGALDRTLGVIFGIVRGVLLVGIIYLPVYANVTTESKQKWMEGSKTAPYLEVVAGWLYALVPEDMRTEVEKLSGEGNPAQKLLEAQGLTGGDPAKEGETSGGAPADPATGDAKPDDAKPKDTQGYTDKDRKAMDKLIEEKTQGKGGLNE